MKAARDQAADEAASGTRILIVLASTGPLTAAALAGAIVAFGITRPLADLAGVLERMVQGETDGAIKEGARKQAADATADTERRRAMIAFADRFESAVGGTIGQVWRPRPNSRPPPGP